MVRHHPYKSNSKAYEDYYCSQAGHGLPVFIGGQRGRGLGSLLGGVGRSLLPLLKSGGKVLLKEGARTGMRMANDVLSGQNVKSVLRQRGKEASKRLLDRALHKLDGEPPAKKRIKSRTSPRATQIRRRRRKKKTKRTVRDIFG